MCSFFIFSNRSISLIASSCTFWMDFSNLFSSYQEFERIGLFFYRVDGFLRARRTPIFDFSPSSCAILTTSLRALASISGRETRTPDSSFWRRILSAFRLRVHFQRRFVRFELSYKAMEIVFASRTVIAPSDFNGTGGAELSYIFAIIIFSTTPVEARDVRSFPSSSFKFSSSFSPVRRRTQP